MEDLSSLRGNFRLSPAIEAVQENWEHSQQTHKEIDETKQYVRQLQLLVLGGGAATFGTVSIRWPWVGHWEWEQESFTGTKMGEELKMQNSKKRVNRN